MFNEIAESSQLVQHIGWAIIHSLWQSAIIAFALALMLRLLKNSTASARYVVSCAALALTLCCPVATAVLINQTEAAPLASETIKKLRETDSAERETNTSGLAEPGEEALPSSIKTRVSESLDLSAQTEKLFPWLILVWMAGVMILSLRLGAGIFYTARLIKSATPLRESFVEFLMDDLTARLKIERSVRVLESALVKIPMTVGWIFPVILLPPSVVLGLTPQQLQSIIAHELVHIKRYDFLVNLLQAVVETLLFYHPAARWISNKIRQEREFVCDDLTLALCGDAVVYARALTKVARLGSKAEPTAALAATGGDLSLRVYRLIKTASGEPSPRLSFYVPALAALLFLIVLSGLTLCFRPDETSLFGNILSAEINEKKSAIQENAGQEDDSAEVDRLRIYGDDLTNETLQIRKIAVEALAGHRGSVIVMEPQTGQVFSIVNQDWAFRRSWSPASTFKMVTSVAALEENLLSNSEKGFGYDPAMRLNLNEAIALSDNEYFKSLGNHVGAEVLLKYAKSLGFGVKTGIGYDGEIEGFVPNTNSRKINWLGVSGGEIKVTPLQLAVFMSAIANGGKILVPQHLKKGQSLVPQERAQFSLNENTWTEIKKGLRESVKTGPGNAAASSEIDVAGKTGTTDSGKTGTGLFVSYIQSEKKSLVVVVALEGKNETGAVAAQVAGKIYKRLEGKIP